VLLPAAGFASIGGAIDDSGRLLATGDLQPVTGDLQPAPFLPFLVKQLWMILSVKSVAAVRLIARGNRTLTRAG